jgi:two-component system sensor histidine kinase UhpB
VNFSLTTSGLERGYGEAIDLTIFRCVQEALTNALRHGGASRISVEIGEQNCGKTANGGSSPRKLRLRVHDDGEGFAGSAPPGIGLTAMRERVRSIDGSTQIESSPNGGTTISLLVPLRAPTEDVGHKSQPMQSVS